MSDYIYHIDLANQRVNELEAQLGMPKSDFIVICDEANAQIQRLEGKLASRPTPARRLDAPPKPQQSALPQSPLPVVQPLPPQAAVKPLPNDLAAINKAGKVFGLGRAMIAATEQSNQQQATRK